MCMPSAPSMPAPQAPAAAAPPPPTQVDPSVLAARQNAADAARQAQGRNATILGQNQTPGALDAASTNKKTLLGL